MSADRRFESIQKLAENPNIEHEVESEVERLVRNNYPDSIMIRIKYAFWGILLVKFS